MRNRISLQLRGLAFEMDGKALSLIALGVAVVLMAAAGVAMPAGLLK